MVYTSDHSMGLLKISIMTIIMQYYTLKILPCLLILVTPYEHCRRKFMPWLVIFAWRHEAICWISVDLSSIGSSGIIHYDVRHQVETFSALLTIFRGTHRSPVDSLHKGQWREALLFSLIDAWSKGWANNRYDGDLRCHGAHCDVTIVWVQFHRKCTRYY